MQQNGGEGTGRLHGQPDDLSSQKMSAMDVDMGRHPVPPGLNPRKVVSRALGATVPWLFGIALFTYVDRSNLSFAALTMKADLHLSNTEYGLGAAIFFIAYCIAQLPATWIMVHVGAPVPLAIMVIAWGAVSAGTSGINGTGTFYLVRFLLGLCEGGTFPGAWHHLSTFFNTLELGVGYAAVASATALSQVIGAPLAAALLLMDGVGGRHGWTWLFLIEGLLTIVFGVAVYLFLPRRPATLRVLQPAERTWLQERHEHADRHARSKTSNGGKFWDGMISWRLWYLGVCWFLVETAIYGILFWTPLLLEALLTHNFDGTHPTTHNSDSKSLALANAKIALLSVAVFAPAAAIMIGNSYLSKHFKERNFHGGIPVVISGIAFLVLPVAIFRGGVVAGFIMLIIAAAGAWAVHGPLWSWPASFLVGPAKSAGIACYNTCGAAGGFVGPFLIGYMSDHYGGFAPPMYLLGAFNVLAGLMIIVFRAPNFTQEHLDDDDVAAPGAKLAGKPQGIQAV